VCDIVNSYVISILLHIIVTMPLQNLTVALFDILWPDKKVEDECNHKDKSS